MSQLILLLILFQSFCHRAFSNEFQISTSTKQLNRKIRKQIHATPMQCLHRCDLDKRCKEIGMTNDSQVCLLLGEIIQEDTELPNGQMINFYQKAGTEKQCFETYTNCNENGGGRVESLDRHDLKCPFNYALKSFQLKRCSESQYQYIGECCKLPNGVTKVTRYNDYSFFEFGRAVYLDRQTVECRSESNPSYITSFKLETGTDKLRYRYNCYSVLNQQKCCYNTETLETFNGGNYGDVLYLDRQKDVKCEANFFLSEFKLNRRADVWKYSYQCCKSC